MVRPAVLRRIPSRPQPLTATAPAERERGTPDPARRPAGYAAGNSAIPADGQHDDDVLEASAINNAAVAAYRLSVQAADARKNRRSWTRRALLPAD